jgi:exopolyphosphatase / guanosine-5'-triphosphate,3'-diphosphate pyrophosphatase
MARDKPSGAARAGGRAPKSRAPLFAALDLGTNNCRMLMAAPDGAGGLRVVDGFSRIVRLGEGLAHTGRLSETAMARAYQALVACAQRLEARAPVAVGCVATQACRAAANGETFLNRIRTDLGLDFKVIPPQEEASLSVLGCASLLDPEADVALIVDTGGGSTELAWVVPKNVHAAMRERNLSPPLAGWASVDLGVVGLADEEAEPNEGKRAWYEELVGSFVSRLEQAADPAMRLPFLEGRAHIVGTSGTVTSFAGVHLGLQRYERARVDGLWLTADDCRRVINMLLHQTREERARHGCIGKERADLIVYGGAIFDAVCRVWPTERIRVADRGLREGVLMKLIATHTSTS